MESLREKNRLLIYRCFNILNRQAELSGPQVISYLMNWGDHITSHQFVSVYWGQLANALTLVYPSLRRSTSDECYTMENKEKAIFKILYIFHNILTNCFVGK
jgi:hypothetical protein